MKTKLNRSIELLLWTTAALCFGCTAVGVAMAVQAHRQSESLAEQPLIAAVTRDKTYPAQMPTQQVGDVIGRVRISALGLSVPMTAGIETTSLLKGVGHVEGTAFPGGLGTLGLAGHRDTYLRPLENVAPGMDIEVLHGSGTFHYMVDSSEIVTPEQVDVLSIRSRPEMVLITCYPFHYIGAAPKRFVVHAHLVSLTPDGQKAKQADSE